MLEYPINDAELVQERARYIVSSHDWYNFNNFMVVALHNGLKQLALGSSFPSDKTWEQWHEELAVVISKLKWLHVFDDTSMALYEWCLGETTMELVDTATNNKRCVFFHEREENVNWYFNEAAPALEARKKQITNEIFEWVKINFEDLWD